MVNKSDRFVISQWLLITIIICLTFVIYIPVLNTPFLHADYIKIVNNPDIRDIGTIADKLVYPYTNELENTRFRNDPSRPAVYLTYAVNYLLGNMDTWGYHLFNVTIHIINAILIFFLIKKLLLIMFNDTAVTIPAFFSAIVFALHPANGYTVSYIFRRSDLMMACFYFSAILFFIAAIEGKKVVWNSFMTFVCFALALLSKQSAVTLPATLLIIDFLLIGNFSISWTKRRVFLHIVSWSLAACYVALRYWYFGGIGDLEAHKTLEQLQYILVQPYSIMSYIRFILFPTRLSFYYAIEFAQLHLVTIVVPMMIFFAVCALAAYVMRKSTRTGTINKTFLFSFAWFFITISPTSSIFPTTQFLAPNRLYLPEFGFCFAIGIAGFLIYKKLIENSTHIRALAILSVAVIYVWGLCLITLHNNAAFADPLELWKDVISRFPNSYLAHSQLGTWYFRSNEYEKAAEEFRATISIDPAESLGYDNLSLIYRRMKEYEKAFVTIRQAIKKNPFVSNNYYCIGLLYEDTNEFRYARNAFLTAIRINPSNHDAIECLTALNNRFRNEIQSEVRNEKVHDVFPIEP